MRRVVIIVVVGFLIPTAARPRSRGMWETTPPESRGMDAAALESARDALKERGTTALLILRRDRIVFERYSTGFDRHKPLYTASMAKALVGGLGMVLAMGDGRIKPDDPAWRHVPRGRDDPKRQGITIRHLATGKGDDRSTRKPWRKPCSPAACRGIRGTDCE